MINHDALAAKEKPPKSPMLERKLPGKPASKDKHKPVKLHASHVLSMDVMMTTGLEMGGHSADIFFKFHGITDFIYIYMSIF
jgi:hypothetical protein